MSDYGEATISPVFRYNDADAAMAWLAGAFGFSTHEVHKTPAGEVVHGEMRFGASGIGISTAGPVVPGNPWSEVRLGIYVCLQQVDPFFSRAERAGARVAQALNDTSYGAREGSLRDPGGHLWSVGTYPIGAADGSRSLFTALHYTDGPAAAAFLREAFGFAPGLMVEAPGVVHHGELRLGRDLLMISSSPKECGHWGVHAQCTCVLVDEPDAHFARATAAGATVLQPPQDTPYGARGYYVQDPEGFVWGFSNYRAGQ
jgi:uncharacterized glyoxalase superfamily protein PhnB